MKKKIIKISTLLTLALVCLSFVLAGLFLRKQEGTLSQAADSPQATVTMAINDLDPGNARFVPGGTYTLTTTIHFENLPDGSTWKSVTLYVGVTSVVGCDANGQQYTSELNMFNANIASLLSVEGTAPSQIAQVEGDFGTYVNNSGAYFGSGSGTSANAIMYSFGANNVAVPSDVDLVIKTQIKVSDDLLTTGIPAMRYDSASKKNVPVTDDQGDPVTITELEGFVFNVFPAVRTNIVAYKIPTSTAAKNLYTYNNQVTVTELNISTGTASTEAEMKNLSVGRVVDDGSGNEMTGDDYMKSWEKTDATPISQTLTYISTYGGLEYIVRPVPTDVMATVYADFGVTDPTTKITGGEGTVTLPSSDISATDGTANLYVKVLAEDGETSKIYVVTVSVGYARLESLTSQTTHEEPDKSEGAEEGAVVDVNDDPIEIIKVLDEDDEVITDYEVTDYTVNVRKDFTKLVLKAAVLPGYEASTDLTFKAATNCEVKDMSGTAITSDYDSANEFEVALTDTEDPKTLQIELTGADGLTKHVYNFTFELVSTEAKIEEVIVYNINDQTITYSNNLGRANDEGVDFYFLLPIDGSGTEAAYSEITVSEGATYAVTAGDGCTFTPKDDPVPVKDMMTNGGVYTVKVTAQAGNSEEYTVKLHFQYFVKLKDDASARFVYEYIEDDDFGTLYYRSSYNAMGMEHGVDDLSLSSYYPEYNEETGSFEPVYVSVQYVIGRIAPKTCINDFLANFDEETLKKLELYMTEGPDDTDRDDDFCLYKYGEQILDDYDMSDPDEWAIGTGWYIRYGESGEENDSKADYVYLSVLGDNDGDGVITSNDISFTNDYIRNRDFGAFSSCARLACYISNEGEINANCVSYMCDLIRSGGSDEEYEEFFSYDEWFAPEE